MKVIRIVYEYTEIDPSIFLLLYFRLIGVYVSEEFIGQAVGPDTELDYLLRDYPTLNKNDNIVYDAEICLFSNIEFVRQYNYVKGKNVVIVLNRDIEKYVADEKSAVIYNPGKTKKLLNDILEQMYLKKLITSEELNECQAVAAVYCGHSMMATTLSAKYFFIADTVEQYRKKNREYVDAVNALEDELSEMLHSSHNQEYKYEYLRYAILSTKYDTDLYCKRNHWVYEYNDQELIKEAKEFEVFFTNVINSLRSLIGQIYDDLVGDKNAAYEYYLKCCQKEDRHNAYVFMIKGRYWQDFVGDYELAIKYYLKSITLFNEYYRSWYKMGYCYYYLKQPSKMLISFDMVRKILQKRLDADTIRPMEMEHLFLACIQCADILYQYNWGLSRAIGFNLLAERVWDRVGFSSCFSLMCRNAGEKGKYVKEVRKKLNIKRVYNSLMELYRLSDMPDKAAEYEWKYMRVE